MNEIWKEIDGYEGYYQVSNFGRVKSVERTIVKKNGKEQVVKERILKPQITNRGHHYVVLSKDFTKQNINICLLVANAFIKKGSSEERVIHKNNDKLNNAVENLEWVLKYKEVIELPKKSYKEIFIEKAVCKHGDRFDYSKFEYVNAKTKSIIICKEHGEFVQNPDKHLNSKYACPTCTNLAKKYYTPLKTIKREEISKEEFLKRFHNKHGDKFALHMSHYIGLTKGYILLYCDTHKESKYVPQALLQNEYGCKHCGHEISGKSKTKSYDDFILDANIKHNNFYTYPDYNRSVFENRKSIITIECPKHGQFQKKAQKHLSGQGCFECKIEDMIKEGVLIGGYSDKIFEDNPEIAKEKGFIYYLKIGNMYKIGVTRISVEQRRNSLKSISKFPVEILDYKEMTIKDCYKLEQKILNKFSDERIYTKWSTELFKYDVLNGKIKNIENYDKK